MIAINFNKTIMNSRLRGKFAQNIIKLWDFQTRTPSYPDESPKINTLTESYRYSAL